MGLVYSKLGAAAVFLMIFAAFGVLVSATGDDTYVRAYVPDHIDPGDNVWVSGEAIQGGGAFNGTINISILNSTGQVINYSNITTNSATGAFNISLALPSYEDEFTVNVSTNDSTVDEKSYTANTSYFQDASLEFIGQQPPFAPGDTMTIKATVKYENGTAVAAGYAIAMGVYTGNGKVVSWGTEQTNATLSDGTTSMSFTVAATADPGEYIVDMYGQHMVFTVKLYSVSSQTLDNESESSAYFPPESTVDFYTKVKNATDDPQTGATVYATVVYPNGTETDPIEMTSSSSQGIYDHNYTLPTTTGTYKVKINTTIGTTTEETQSTFTVQDVKLALERSTFGDHFDFWGGEKVISPGGNVSFDIKVFDLSTAEMLPVRTTTDGKGVNCSSLVIINVIHMSTGLNVTASVTGNDTTTSTSLKFMGESLCTITFRTPVIPGTYKMTLNTTVNASTTFVMKSVSGYVTTQNYKLKVIPISVMGRDKFHVLLKPGKNASFKLEARNITSKATLTTPNLDAVTVTALTSMGEFSFGGSSDTRNVLYWYSNSSRKLTVYIPENFTGPTLAKVQATLITASGQGETLTGDGFFFAKYVMGFVGPQHGGMMGGAPGGGEMASGGMGGSPGGGPMGMGGTAMSCAGMLEFQGYIMDVETSQALENVMVTKGTIREELTGRDVSACFNITTGGGGRSDSSGQADFNMSFVAAAGCPYDTASQLSGFYFTIWDAKYQNYTDSLPGGFECKNFNFWPYMSNWDLGPNSTVNFTISNVAYMNNMSKYVSNGTVTVARMMNFDPSRGPTVLDLSNVTTLSFEGYNVTYSLEPRNFTNLVSNNNNQWYSGFYDCMLKVCDNNNTASSADDTCDTSFGGFGVFPFRAYVMSNVWASSYVWDPGSTYTIEIWSEHDLGENVTIKRMDFMTGEQVDINLIHNLSTGMASNMGGGVNITVNFTLPSTLEKGDGMIMFTITNNNSESVTTDVFAQISTFTVVSPQYIWPGSDAIQQDQKCFQLDGSYEQTNETLNITNPQGDETLGNAQDVCCGGGFVYPDTTAFEAMIANIRAWNLSVIWVNHTIQSSKYTGGVSGGYILYENIFNRSEHLLVIGNGTPGSSAYPTYSHMFVKVNGTNGSDEISGTGYTLRGPFTTGDHIGGGIYLMGFDYGYPKLIASNETQYTTLVGEGQLNQFWSSEWGWAGRHKVNDNISIPFVVTWANTSKDVGANVTISSIAGANFDKKGFTAPLESSEYSVNDATADANGIAVITLNVSRSGMFRPFWWVNSSTGVEEAAGFDNAMMMQISAFECYGQWVSGTGSGMGGVMLNSVDENVTGIIQTGYFNFSSVANANISLSYMDFRGTFGQPTETSLTTSSDLYDPANGSLLTADMVRTNSTGQLTVTIKPSAGWPTSQYGECVEIQGTATAELDTAGTTYTERFFIGMVCSPPTGV